MAGMPLPRTYRPTVAGRIAIAGLTFVLATFNVLAVIGLATSGRPAGEWISASLVPSVVSVALVVFTFVYLRSRVEAREDGVTVVNYTGTRRFAWGDVERFEVGFAYWGATLAPREGAPIKLNAVQKSNLNHWLKRRARADRIVDELNAILGERRGEPVDPVPPPPPGSLP